MMFSVGLKIRRLFYLKRHNKVKICTKILMTNTIALKMLQKQLIELTGLTAMQTANDVLEGRKENPIAQMNGL